MSLMMVTYPVPLMTGKTLMKPLIQLNAQCLVHIKKNDEIRSMFIERSNILLIEMSHDDSRAFYHIQ